MISLEEEKRLTNDQFLQNALKRLKENYFSKRKKIEKLFDIDDMRLRVSQIKKINIENLEQNIANFIKQATENGATVLYAKDKVQANKHIIDILKNKGVKNIVKSKSLTTEELKLNEFLTENGFEVVETDLGEWLVQINNEPPTHMTAPAIHLSKERIRDLLNRVFNENLEADPKLMVDFCKSKIKQAFKEAQCGIIGANAASAESGSLFILSNEGNIQNVLKQKLVIAVVGVDKIVKNDKEAFEVVDLLPKAATAQIATSYLDVLKSTYGEFYIILLDNGRLELAKDETFKDILYCIHCGACQNACPVYTTVSGLMFKGASYAGPVGVLLSYLAKDTPNLHEVANLCIGCMACDEICSVHIPIQSLILSIKAQTTKKQPFIKGLIIKHLENHYEILRLSSLFSSFLFKEELKTGIEKIDKALGLNFRALPPPKKSFDISVKTKQAKIGLFAGCSVNFIYPEIGEDLLKLADKLNEKIEVIEQKSCCGAPAWYNGEKKSAFEACKINVEYLLSFGFEKILFVDPHCAHMVKRDYVEFGYKNAIELSSKVECAGRYFLDVIKNNGIKTKRLGGFVGYHHPCHLKRGLGYSDEFEMFIRTVEPNFVQLNDSDRCCGFAGSYSMMHPFVSKSLLDEKLKNIKDAGLQVLITACPGCMMQISGGAKIKGMVFETLHFISYLNKIV
ncbi:heterodisulfide reductase-related iron-sulfur binding cluster [Hippea jasoniae]|uniref:heterodisulfide reductase-related iron-sulfur binding cluster n=1 Tax=Hippea jasoniae TaxID=944479 RepID=UPI000558DC8D|nr:heterodisulfide reductase-related iron-sulfur binding cluster [Hippea jasoniae]